VAENLSRAQTQGDPAKPLPTTRRAEHECAAVHNDPPHKRKIDNRARGELLAQPSHFNYHSERSRGISLFPTHRNGNVTAAAKKLDISRRRLHRKINEMNLSKNPALVRDADARSS